MDEEHKKEEKKMSSKHFGQVMDIVGGYSSKNHDCFDFLHHMEKVTCGKNRFKKSFKHAKKGLKGIHRKKVEDPSCVEDVPTPEVEVPAEVISAPM